MGEVDITGEYPTTPNQDKASWNLKGVKAGIPASRLNQEGTSHNDSTVRGAAGRTSNISKQAKG